MRNGAKIERYKPPADISRQTAEQPRPRALRASGARFSGAWLRFGCFSVHRPDATIRSGGCNEFWGDRARENEKRQRTAAVQDAGALWRLHAGRAPRLFCLLL